MKNTSCFLTFSLIADTKWKKGKLAFLKALLKLHSTDRHFWALPPQKHLFIKRQHSAKRAALHFQVKTSVRMTVLGKQDTTFSMAYPFLVVTSRAGLCHGCTPTMLDFFSLQPPVVNTFMLKNKHILLHAISLTHHINNERCLP